MKIEGICNNQSYATRAAALNVPQSIWSDYEFCVVPSAEEDAAILLGKTVTTANKYPLNPLCPTIGSYKKMFYIAAV